MKESAACFCHWSLAIGHPVFAGHNSWELLLDVYLHNSLGVIAHSTNWEIVLPFEVRLHIHPLSPQSSYYQYPFSVYWERSSSTRRYFREKNHMYLLNKFWNAMSFIWETVCSDQQSCTPSFQTLIILMIYIT